MSAKRLRSRHIFTLSSMLRFSFQRKRLPRTIGITFSMPFMKMMNTAAISAIMPSAIMSPYMSVDCRSAAAV